MTERFAVITGSGFEAGAAVTGAEIPTNRFGRASAPLQQLRIGNQDVLALARHGIAHSLPPHAINYRANMQALKDAGAGDVVALCTVGIASDICAPGDVGIPRQILDYTWGREHTVFDGDDGRVEHVDFSEPFCQRLRAALLTAAESAGVRCYDGGTYAATQGPRLETAAEVDRLQNDGADYIGMTAMPEAVLARELGMRYAVIALVVNLAAGRGELPIHSEVELHSRRAHKASKSILDHFFM